MAASTSSIIASWPLVDKTFFIFSGTKFKIHYTIIFQQLVESGAHTGGKYTGEYWNDAAWQWRRHNPGTGKSGAGEAAAPYS